MTRWRRGEAEEETAKCKLTHMHNDNRTVCKLGAMRQKEGKTRSRESGREWKGDNAMSELEET